MSTLQHRSAYVTTISDVVRQITWQSHKQLLKTLSRPDIGLTMPQMVTLFAIRDAQTCRMSELADVTQQSAGTLTGIVDRLIDDNLVGRVRDIDDRRVVQVTLTSAGEERVSRVEQARHEDMDRMLQHFDLSQLGDLECLLRLLLTGLHEMLSGEEPAEDAPHHPMITPLRPV
ncbi:MarR family transcriptional regulator [Oscillochloris sp. ZM17-4]|uniref:MarR family winged helix-turn-helix transcriptional regulator n=1 Tax=Oscillochloris sp. ZM17-4 TaxID=2866714 RepID=UPI001C73AC40|nr:MarR family transcriptional regulator [Oscillochloris sp. ZM17-4]MBX0330462.1 MarR family transcriptional regulator [Oscillochloris sp. ZM17-4]